MSDANIDFSSDDSLVDASYIPCEYESRLQSSDEEPCSSKKTSSTSSPMESSFDETEVTLNSTPQSILFKRFFIILKKLRTSEFHKNRGGILAQCCLCEVQLRGSLQVTSNFIRHLRLKHKNEFKNYRMQKAENSKPRHVNEDHFKKLTVRVIANNMLPISIVEDKSFRDLITYANPSLKLMSRPTTVKMIDQLYSSMVDDIKKKIKNTSFFCTTADLWSTKHRSFFGYTCHWLDESFKRHSVALSCQRFIGSHTYDRIHDVIQQIHQTFELNAKNVRATVTDNGSNFLKAFNEFGVGRAYICSEKICGIEELEVAEEGELPDFISNIFENALPKHIKCATHTLNLLATTDLIRILKDNPTNFQRYQNVMAKCSNLWSKVNRPKSSEVIIAVLGAQLKYPVITRWNSMYDSVVNLIGHKEKLNELCTRLEVPKLSENDFKYLEEYLQVLRPIAEAVDFLQTHNGMVYGFLLPTLATIRTKYQKLQTNPNIKLFASVANLLQEALQSRFENYFCLKDNVQDAIIASVLCPQVKLRWITSLNPSFDNRNIQDVNDLVKRKVLTEYSKLSITCIDQQKEHVASFFEFSENAIDDSDLINSVTSIENEYLAYMADKTSSTDMLQRYPMIKKAYIKYNTPLPSSAAVERLFSYASLINTPRRGSLSDNNFQKLLLLKANEFI